ncbi:hypothetical protein TD95_003323 [Thielaviopsis punctulata]|uniref:tRNA (adenine(58)-N(1))-methyltransferase catalytic subunit TRM61 n=1 Tax=Thielaviopsis punctulata TaxID=72032 RepID=A0A0F4ZCE1_9PEZI|nr:hypothetical protein TD95_003323 [Thielaviopsis punctulata]
MFCRLFGSRVARQLWATSNQRCYSSIRKSIQEYDVLLLHQNAQSGGKFTVTPPLRPNETLTLAYGGQVSTNLLLQRHILDAVTDSRGNVVDIYEPSLPAYIHNAPHRLATPIYAQDASLITALLDVHPDNSPDAAPYEIFEAGTGIGGLTLHLARAVHGANPPLPTPLRDALVRGAYSTGQPRDNAKEALVEDHHVKVFDDAAVQALHDEWLAQRRAVVHTLDLKHSHSRYAHKLIRNFRRAQYLMDVSFHVATIESYLGGRLVASEGRPFLDCAFLDLPEPEAQVDTVMKALKPDGTLLVFSPSVTQIARVIRWAKSLKPAQLRLEKTLELPLATNNDATLRVGTGGKEWDVRYVRTKKAAKAGEKDEDDEVLVCRPMVYQRTVGGGFVGVFRRLLGTQGRVVYEGSLNPTKRNPRYSQAEGAAVSSGDTAVSTVSTGDAVESTEDTTKPAQDAATPSEQTS